MLGRRARAVITVACLLVLAVEGVALIRYYDRYHGSDDASGAPSGSAPTSGATVPEGTVTERTALEKTIVTGDDPSRESATASLHRATEENSRGDYTYLGDPAIDADADAVVLVVSAKNAGGEEYGRNVGVWYEPGEKKWAIFNQDRAAVPAGSSFGVTVPPADRAFVHRAAPANTVGNATYIDDPLTNGRPGAEVSVTQNWNPGGGGGVYNDHPVGAFYDGDVERWFVYNEDGARVPEGAAFNIAVSGATGPAR